MVDKTSREHYKKSRDQLEILVSASTLISQGAEGRPSETLRHYLASLLYARLCGWGFSIVSNLPGNKFSVAKYEYWDLSTIASLARSYMECYLTFFYLCVEPTEYVEWEFRWNIFNLNHSDRTKKHLMKIFPHPEYLSNCDAQAKKIRECLRKNSRFLSLNEKNQNQCLKGKTLYFPNREELIKRIGLEAQEYFNFYILMSSHVHTLPLAFFPIGQNNRGLGMENDIDRCYISFCINSVAKFIRRSSCEMIDLFPGADSGLSESFRSVLLESKDND